MAELTINRLATSIAVFVVYYLFRDNKRNNAFRIIVFVLAFVSLSFEIFYRETLAVILLPFYMCMLAFLLILFGNKIKLVIFPLLILNLLVWFQLHESFNFGVDESDSNEILSIHKGFYSFATIIGILFILHLTRAMYYNLLKPPQNHNGHNFIYGQTDEETNQIIGKLTIREREIYLMKLKGKTNKEIANILKVDLSTVKTHINNIHKKFETADKIK
ncbi:MAG: helix-turn-helix transcriptional regulator [Bacteroidales bacterium]|nr:helix-turn-helix transcriptional regulator [Bacteroidales bacterium]